MADDLITTLEDYKVQLEQVEAAVLAEPDNEELKKLKVDLEEVIALTEDLINNSAPTTATSSAGASSGGGVHNLGGDDSDDEFANSLSRPLKDWMLGDQCLAKSPVDGKYNEAIVKSIDGDKATVVFLGKNIVGTNRLVQLRFVEPKTSKDKRHPTSFQLDRERRRQKAQKKAQKLKDLEDAKESEKNKWKQFNNKALSKQLKGVKKASIFASPEAFTGKVGVGTCGTGGKDMTQLPNTFKGYVRTAQGGYQ